MSPEKPLSVAEFIGTHDLCVHAVMAHNYAVPDDHEPTRTAKALHRLAASKARVRRIDQSHVQGFTGTYLLQTSEGELLILARSKNPYAVTETTCDRTFPGEYRVGPCVDPDYRFLPAPIGLRSDARWVKPSSNNY